MVKNPFPEIRLFTLCDGMRWTHLPVAGGLYDQHPQLMDRFRYLFSEREKYREEKEAQERRERVRPPQCGKGGRRFSG